MDRLGSFLIGLWRTALILVMAAFLNGTAACGGTPVSNVIWGIQVTPNSATAISGTAPGNAADFSVIAHYKDGRSAPWTGPVQWSVDAGWVDIQNGHAVCVSPAPLGVFNFPTIAAITASVDTNGTTLTGPAGLTCF